MGGEEEGEREGRGEGWEGNRLEGKGREWKGRGEEEKGEKGGLDGPPWGRAPRNFWARTATDHARAFGALSCIQNPSHD
jgi:hypothetical protein